MKIEVLVQGAFMSRESCFLHLAHEHVCPSHVLALIQTGSFLEALQSSSAFSLMCNLITATDSERHITICSPHTHVECGNVDMGTAKSIFGLQTCGQLHEKHNQLDINLLL